MNAQERLTYLLEVVEIPTDRMVTLSDIESAVGQQAYQLVRLTLDYAAKNPVDDTPQAKLDAINLGDAIRAMSGPVLSLSAPARQLVIDRLATNQVMPWPDQLRKAVKALGIRSLARWQTLDYQSEPTLETVQAEMDAARLINAKALFAERMTIDGDASTTWTQAWTDAEA